MFHFIRTFNVQKRNVFYVDLAFMNQKPQIVDRNSYNISNKKEKRQNDTDNNLDNFNLFLAKTIFFFLVHFK